MVDSGASVAGIQNDYARGDHQHPLQVSEQIPSRDTGTGAAGTSTAYSRADHQHILNTDPTVANMPQKDTGTGNNRYLDYYARSNHAHPPNVDPTVANVLLVNATAAANEMSDFYSKNDHVHPQQLTYDGNITATKFIKTGGLATEILCANGDTTNKNGVKSQSFPQDLGATAKYIKLCRFEAYTSFGDTNVEFKFYSRSNFNGLKIHVSYDTTGLRALIYHYLQQVTNSSFRLPTMLYYGTGLSKYGELWMTVGNYQGNEGRIDLLSQTKNGAAIVSYMLTNQIVDTLPSDFTTNEDLLPNLQYITETINNAPFLQNGIAQINPVNGNGNEGLRIANNPSNYSLFCIGCDPNSTSGAIANQWSMYKKVDCSLLIVRTSEQNTANRGLQISADGNTLKFNGRVL
ncbi:MAG: hypothetical protein EZS28_009883 [Streblomastix strix]|uniref:Uncharacterized protein n=1 Tax=Streblomastix strix TaxID=222440 RepID=A0A5J4WJA0_9EUKA|nr:MAG: hypothetical protein EZS28_009883 [Streblomastix strix]